MPLKDLDTSQKKAAASRGSEIAVSAGAGSGKTRLLVGRYLHILQDGTIPMQEIAAITFTEKAAAQMKAAVARKARTLAVSSGEKSLFWQHVADSVYTAPISTIHAFCNAILRRYPAEAGIDPLYSIADDATISELMGEALDSHMVSRFDAAPEDMEALLRCFGLNGLRRTLAFMLHKRIGILTFLDTYDGDGTLDIERRYEAFIADTLARYNETIRQFHAAAPGEDALGPVLGEILDGLARIRSDGDDYPKTADFAEDIMEIITANLRRGSSPKWDAAGHTLRVVKDNLKELRSFLEIAIRFFRYEAGISAHITQGLLDEFRLLEQRFLDMKKSLSILDHDDTLIETWRLLRSNFTVLSEVSQSYRHILVDEFQDTDSLQVDILRMIAGNSSATLFTVGDPKQSIYRFRGADVGVFNEFVAGKDVEFKTLKINYRSSPEVIGFINHVFARIMGRDERLEKFHAEYMDMKPNRPSGERASGVELVVFENIKGDSLRYREAEYIALRIEELRQCHGYAYGDMALILRKGTATGPYEETFLSHGIPYVNMTTGDTSTFGVIDDCANLLGWLCNPADHRLFAAVLISPFFTIAPESLYSIRVAAGEPEGMPAVFFGQVPIEDNPLLANHGLESARDTLSSLLSVRHRLSIRDLLERAFDKTGYTLRILADPVRGELSLSVLDRICELADRFEQGGGSIVEFARLLGSGSLSNELAPSVEALGDTVSIITIHKAKGLEYGIVFLADITSKPASGSPSVGIHEELGIGYTMRDRLDNTFKSFPLAMSEELESKKDAAENKRLLYVGCTRAADRLIVTGGSPSKTPDPHFENKNWMNWLHAALGIGTDGVLTEATSDGLFEYHRFVPEDEEETQAESDSRAIPELHSKTESTPAIDISAIVRRPSPMPPSFAPEHLSPTRILDYIECPAYYLYRHIYALNPANGTVGGEGYGERYGTYAHRVLEHLWYRDSTTSGSGSGETSGDSRTETVSGLVDRLAGKDTPHPWKNKLAAELTAYAGTPLYKRIATAGSVPREAPFAFVLEDVLVRGAIDLLYRTDDGTGIVDFKTDAVTAEEALDVGERYRLQIGIYAYAVDRAEYALPASTAIHFLTPGITVPIDCSQNWLGEIENTLTVAIRSITEGKFPRKETGRCRTCLYRHVCGMGDSGV